MGSAVDTLARFVVRRAARTGHETPLSRLALVRTAPSTRVLRAVSSAATTQWRRDGRVLWLGAAAAILGARVVRILTMESPASERLELRPGQAFEIRVVGRGRR